MWKVVASGLVLVGLVGCESFRDYRMERSLAKSRAEALAQIDEDDCRSKGGTVKQVGLFGTPACVTPFPDGGEPCSSNAECDGACFAPSDAAIGAAAVGACQVDTAAMFGCYDHVEGGVVVGGLCVD